MKVKGKKKWLSWLLAAAVTVTSVQGSALVVLAEDTTEAAAFIEAAEEEDAGAETFVDVQEETEESVVEEVTDVMDSSDMVFGDGSVTEEAFTDEAMTEAVSVDVNAAAGQDYYYRVDITYEGDTDMPKVDVGTPVQLKASAAKYYYETGEEIAVDPSEYTVKWFAQGENKEYAQVTDDGEVTILEAYSGYIDIAAEMFIDGKYVTGISVGLYLNTRMDDSGWEYYVMNGTEAWIVGYSSADSEIRVPEMIDNYPVTRIEGLEGHYEQTITTIIIPESVVKISNLGWEGGLSSIILEGKIAPAADGRLFQSLPENLVVTIPAGATGYDKFPWTRVKVVDTAGVEQNAITETGSCGEHASWTLTDGTLTISGTGEMYEKGINATESWPWPENKVKSVVIGEGITTIGTCAFKDCHNLTSISIPNTVTQIGSGAFSYCTSLKHIRFPGSLTVFGKDKDDSADDEDGAVFYGCTSLTSIQIPDGVTEIPELTFAGCTSLQTVVFPDSVTQIDIGAFSGCSSLAEIKLPENLTKIASMAFWRCSAMKYIYIPDKVTVIGSEAFSQTGDTPIMRAITIPPSVTSIGAGSFWVPDPEFRVYTTPGSVAAEWAVDNGWTCVTLASMELSASVFPFNGQAQKPAVTVKDSTGAVLTEGTDYSVSYRNNINEGTATAVITGAGRYIGSLEKNFSIHNHSWDGGEVTKNATCTEEGIKTFTCSVCGETRTETIPKTAHTYVTETTKATTGKDGSITEKCSACGLVKSSTVIAYPKKITLSKTSYTYNGKVQKPRVVVKGSDGSVISASNYKVSYSKGCKNVGKYTVKITFQGNYSGNVSKTYTINPKGTRLSSVSAKSKGFTVKWRRQTSQTRGYQIQYSLYRNFKKASTKTITSNRTTAKTYTRLKAGKKYYVRIRTYKTVSGKKYYSSWSGAKAVRTKK